MAKNFWNFWGNEYELADAAPAVVEKYSMPKDAKLQVAELLSQCAKLDDEMTALRDKKRILSRQIARIENDALANRPVNPLGAMKIGG